MANEYQDLATINDADTEAVVTVRRMYQEDGGRGIEIVVDHNHGEVVKIFKAEDLVPRYRV